MPESRPAAIDTAVEGVVDFLTLAERLKRELRHSWLSDGRQESVAEHTWMMSTAAVMLAPLLETPVNLGHALKLIALHDIAEAITGDIPSFEESPRKATKAEEESKAIATLAATLPAPSAALLLTLWQEYEEARTPEAKFARALDKLEVQLQHNLADLESWTPVEFGLVYTKMDRECAHDATLRAMRDVIRHQAEQKMVARGVDLAAVKTKAHRP